MSVELVRLLIGDKIKAAVNENVGQGDGVNRFFQLDMFPLASAPSATLTILLTGVIAATNTYTLSGGVGNITFATGSEPAAGASILAQYKYYTLTSGEVSDILSGHTGSPYLAAANAALVIAADTSRYFSYTMGDKTINKSKITGELRELSKDLENRHFTMKNKVGYDSEWATFKDNSGTVYDSYDTAVAYLGSD